MLHSGRSAGLLLVSGALLTLLAASPGVTQGRGPDPAALEQALTPILPGTPPTDIRRAAEALANDPHSPATAVLLAPLLAAAAAAPDSKIADAIEAPGNTVAVDVSAGRSLDGWVSELTKGSPEAKKLARFLPGLGVEAEAGKSGATLKAGLSGPFILSSVAMNADPASRSVMLTLDLGSRTPQKREVEVHDVVRLKFTYKDNHDYLTALLPIPGRETVLDFMNRIVPGVQDLKGNQQAGALPAALQAFQRTIAPNAERFANFESYTYGTGVDVVYKTPDPTGAAGTRFGEASVKLSFSNMERTAAGKPSGQGTQFIEAGVSIGGKTGSVGGYSGGASLTLAHTTDPDAQTQDPNLHTIAESVRKGRPMAEVLTSIPNPINSRNVVKQALESMLRSPEGKDPGSGGITSVGNGKVGGVMLFYDPALLGSGVPPAELIELFRDLALQEVRGQHYFTVRRGETEEAFHTVSLAAWLRSPESTLGGLTRVRGYVLKPNDLLLIGQVEAGRPPVDPDVLTVALSAVYRDGRTPAVSLDPDLRDFANLHRPRLLGIPERYRESEFTRVLLDADYDMKRIGLGELHVSVPGFLSHYQVVQRSRQSSLDWHQFWLSPFSTGGDVLEDGPVVLFDSRVRVQTERMQQVDQYLAPTGQVSPNAEESAQHLTSHYPEIERELDSFYQLHGVFDVAKLCALLRYRKVTSPLLEAMADRPVAKVSPRQPYRSTLLDSYRGIGPRQVEGTEIAMMGGAISLAEIRPRSFVHSDALKPLQNGDATILREHVVSLAGDEVTELRMRAAAQAFAEDRFDAAVTQAGEVLASTPDNKRAHFLRALANCGRGEFRAALPDLDLLVGGVPQLLLLRALARMGVGDDAGARRDVAAAGKSDPLFDSWQLRAWARVATLDLDGAQKILDGLTEAELASQSGTAYSFRTELDALRKLPPAEARRVVRLQAALPLALRQAFSNAGSAMATGDPASATRSLLRLQSLIDSLESRPAVRAYSSRERALYMQGITYRAMPAEVPRAIECADRLIALHPDWATGYLLKAYCQFDLKDGAQRAAAKAQIDRAFRKPPPPDPLFEEWRRPMGSAEGVRRSFYTLGCMLNLTHKDDSGPYLRESARLPGVDGRIAAFMAKERWLDQIVRNALPKEALERSLPQVRALGKAALAAPPSADLPAVFLRGLLVPFYAGSEQTAGHRGEALRIVRAYLKGLPATDPLGAQGPVALFRSQYLGMLIQLQLAAIEPDPEVKRLSTEMLQDAAKIELLHRRLQELVRAAGEESARNDQPFEASLVAYALDTELLDLEIHALEEPQRGKPSPVYRELSQQAERLRAERVRRLNELPSHFDEWVSLAKSPTEEAALALLLERQRYNLALPVTESRATEQRLQESLRELQRRIRLKHLRRAGR